MCAEDFIALPDDDDDEDDEVLHPEGGGSGGGEPTAQLAPAAVAEAAGDPVTAGIPEAAVVGMQDVQMAPIQHALHSAPAEDTEAACVPPASPAGNHAGAATATGAAEPLAGWQFGAKDPAVNAAAGEQVPVRLPAAAQAKRAAGAEAAPQVVVPGQPADSIGQGSVGTGDVAAAAAEAPVQQGQQPAEVAEVAGAPAQHDVAEATAVPTPEVAAEPLGLAASAQAVGQPAGECSAGQGAGEQVPDAAPACDPTGGVGLEPVQQQHGLPDPEAAADSASQQEAGQPAEALAAAAHAEGGEEAAAGAPAEAQPAGEQAASAGALTAGVAGAAGMGCDATQAPVQQGVQAGAGEPAEPAEPAGPTDAVASLPLLVFEDKGATPATRGPSAGAATGAGPHSSRDPRRSSQGTQGSTREPRWSSKPPAPPSGSSRDPRAAAAPAAPPSGGSRDPWWGGAESPQQRLAAPSSRDPRQSSTEGGADKGSRDPRVSGGQAKAAPAAAPAAAAPGGGAGGGVAAGEGRRTPGSRGRERSNGRADGQQGPGKGERDAKRTRRSASPAPQGTDKHRQPAGRQPDARPTGKRDRSWDDDRDGLSAPSKLRRRDDDAPGFGPGRAQHRSQQDRRHEPAAPAEPMRGQHRRDQAAPQQGPQHAQQAGYGPSSGRHSGPPHRGTQLPRGRADLPPRFNQPHEERLAAPAGRLGGSGGMNGGGVGWGGYAEDLPAGRFAGGPPHMLPPPGPFSGPAGPPGHPPGLQQPGRGPKAMSVHPQEQQQQHGPPPVARGGGGYASPSAGGRRFPGSGGPAMQADVMGGAAMPPLAAYQGQQHGSGQQGWDLGAGPAGPHGFPLVGAGPFAGPGGMGGPPSAGSVPPGNPRYHPQYQEPGAQAFGAAPFIAAPPASRPASFAGAEQHRLPPGSGNHYSAGHEGVGRERLEHGQGYGRGPPPAGRQYSPERPAGRDERYDAPAHPARAPYSMDAQREAQHAQQGRYDGHDPRMPERERPAPPVSHGLPTGGGLGPGQRLHDERRLLPQEPFRPHSASSGPVGHHHHDREALLAGGRGPGPERGLGGPRYEQGGPRYEQGLPLGPGPRPRPAPYRPDSDVLPRPQYASAAVPPGPAGLGLGGGAQHGGGMGPPRQVAPAGPGAGPHGAGHVRPEEQVVWFYLDPKGVVQGPHSIAQFRRWLHSLQQRRDLESDYLAFRSVSVFKQHGGAQVPLAMLLG